MLNIYQGMKPSDIICKCLVRHKTVQNFDHNKRIYAFQLLPHRMMPHLKALIHLPTMILPSVPRLSIQLAVHEFIIHVHKT